METNRTPEQQKMWDAMNELEKIIRSWAKDRE